MQKLHSILYYASSLSGILFLTASASGDKRWTESEKDSIRTVTQVEGATLGYSAISGLKLLTADGYAFKDLNRNGKLDAYEDWRLTPEERAADLASQLSTDEIAGLMLYSNHQSIPGTDQGFWDATYNGKKFKESGAQPDALSDAQQKFLRDDKVRHILITKVQSPAIAARWNNNVQAFIEGLDHGIPANNSSDPATGQPPTRNIISATAVRFHSGRDHWDWLRHLLLTSCGISATLPPVNTGHWGSPPLSPRR